MESACICYGSCFAVHERLISGLFHRCRDSTGRFSCSANYISCSSKPSNVLNEVRQTELRVI